jgi:membrane AbrB-like protein
LNRAGSIGLLLLASCALAAILEGIGLPAGLLLGPMVVAIVFAARGGALPLPPALSMAAQAAIGLLIAPSLNPTVLANAARAPGLFIGGTLATLVAGIVIGWVLARWKVLPGSVAIWGSMPGAATAMVLIARDEGADWQLVAVMSYLRVILVAALASILAAIVTGHGGGHPPGGAWFPPPDPRGLAETAAIAFVGAWGGWRLGVPAAALLGPMVLGAILEGTGLAHPQLPGWLLAPAYLLVGWRIGLGFTPDIVATARHAAPRLLLASSALVLFCAGCGLILAHLSGKDLMTAYLAMSPGGADSVAIIASSTHVDVPFVMSMQVARFVAVLLIGPALARYLARRLQRDRGTASGARL